MAVTEVREALGRDARPPDSDPTLRRLFGHSAWALPRWLDRLSPDVRFGHS